ncbi:MAG: helix-turn-helix domain-containing protein [Chthoniobacterales bacterium]|nr:helix-turn-helix domain-containing protein [Chthoniobacterales bacterium]
MEALGPKLKQARLSRKITLEEASRITKIRPSRIAEIEQEDFSSFPSLAYAKGFLLIYGKFLDVDVTPYLDAFEISDRVTVDGYSYLQDNGPAAPPPLVRRQPRKSPAFVPFLIAVAVLVIGIYLIRLMLNVQRITPAHDNSTGALTSASATATPPPTALGEIVAPRAQPVEGTPASEAGVTPRATLRQPEVRRAEPVNPEDEPSNPSPNESPRGGRR